MVRKKIERCEKQLKILFPKLAPSYQMKTNKRRKIAHSIFDIEVGFKNIPCEHVDVSGITLINHHQCNALLVLLETGVFSHKAKCFILDYMYMYLPPAVEKQYWARYEDLYNNSEHSDVEMSADNDNEEDVET